MNRALVAQSLGVAPSHLLSAWQVHSADAAVVDGPWTSEERPRVDALVTKTPGVGLGVLTADCGPVLFADSRARVIGAAHAGWKGALTGVTTRTLEVMEEQGAARANITAVIGPMISQAAYEVGPEFPARFIDADPANARYFTPSAARRPCDVRPSGLSRGPPQSRRCRHASSICHSAPSVTRRDSSAIAGPRTAMKKTTAGSSRPLP